MTTRAQVHDASQLNSGQTHPAGRYVAVVKRAPNEPTFSVMLFCCQNCDHRCGGRRRLGLVGARPPREASVDPNDECPCPCSLAAGSAATPATPCSLRWVWRRPPHLWSQF
jgi:hypothetical protein